MTECHIEVELRRISERLAAGPDPFEHAGLYAAQQALCWAAQPESFASPYKIIVGSEEGSECCSAPKSPPLFSDSVGHCERQ